MCTWGHDFLLHFLDTFLHLFNVETGTKNNAINSNLYAFDRELNYTPFHSARIQIRLCLCHCFDKNCPPYKTCPGGQFLTNIHGACQKLSPLQNLSPPPFLMISHSVNFEVSICDRNVLVKYNMNNMMTAYLS